MPASGSPFFVTDTRPTSSSLCVILASCWKLTVSLNPVSVCDGRNCIWPNNPAPGPRGKITNTATAIMIAIDDTKRIANAKRVRDLHREHGRKVRVFSAHDPHEYRALAELERDRSGPLPSR